MSLVKTPFRNLFCHWIDFIPFRWVITHYNMTLKILEISYFWHENSSKINAWLIDSEINGRKYIEVWVALTNCSKNRHLHDSIIFLQPPECFTDFLSHSNLSYLTRIARQLLHNELNKRKSTKDSGSCSKWRNNAIGLFRYETSFSNAFFNSINFFQIIEPWGNIIYKVKVILLKLLD